MSALTEEQARAYMHKLLAAMSQAGGSDLFISHDFPPSMKSHGSMTPLTSQKLTGDVTRVLAHAMMNERQREEFAKEMECNFAISIPNISRFRVNVYVQQQHVAMVVRTIASEIPNFEKLDLPPVLKEVIMNKRGLVLVVGGTGSGKSTTLAALIDYRNSTSPGHIITVEDPVEYVHAHKNCIITQREVGLDTEGWQTALKNALRQAPDVILMGEIRDRETMSAAIAYAQSGHLCLATMHANNSYQALNRVLSFYPVEVRPTMLGDLAAALKAVISQRLLRTVEGSRAPAVEVLLNTKLISEMIQKGNFSDIVDAMERSMAEGSQSFEADIARLILEGRVDRKEGMAHADSPTNLMWRMQNDQGLTAKKVNQLIVEEEEEEEEASFTEIVLDVKHE